jgi:ribonuclease J
MKKANTNMIITLHRPNQIGGCITEIESAAGTKIFIDLGHNLPKGGEDAPDEFDSDEAILELTSGAQAILYTHIHGDHIGLFNHVPDGMKQYIGPLAKSLMLHKFQHMRKIPGKKELYESYIKQLEQFEIYDKGHEFKIGDITVTPFQVSHSAADSYMLRIDCDGKTILHTGDFRDHGYMGTGVFKVLEPFHIKDNVVVLITEGTNIGNTSKSMRKESELKKEFSDVIKQYKYVFVICSSTDADRLESIYAANKQSMKRPFVTDDYQKTTMDIISNYADKERPFYHFDQIPIYTYSPTVDKMNWMMENIGFIMLIRRSEKFQGYLDKILQFCKPEQTCLVYSQYHGYIDNREGNTAFNPETYAFIQQFKDRGFAFREIHTSGHASAHTIKKLIETINPKQAIIGIHKDEGQTLESLGLSDELKNKIIDNEWGLAPS